MGIKQEGEGYATRRRGPDGWRDSGLRAYRYLCGAVATSLGCLQAFAAGYERHAGERQREEQQYADVPEDGLEGCGI